MALTERIKSRWEIDERAVQVKNQRADARKIRGSHEPDIVIRLRFAGGRTSLIKIHMKN